MAVERRESDEEPADEILECARAEGVLVTREQLDRWHRAGALPTPRQTPLGPSGGSVTLYPKGTALQAVALARGLQRTRRLDEVACTLWIEGYPIAMPLVRRFLTRVACWHDRLALGAQALGFGNAELPDRALDVLEKAARKHASGAVMTGMWGHLPARGDRETVVRIIMDATAGRYVPTSSPSPSTYERESEGRLVERALGMENGRTESFLDIGPWLDGSPEETLELLPTLMGGRWVEELREMSDNELGYARDSAATMLEVITGMGSSFAELFGQEAFGVGAMGELTKQRTALFDGFILLALARASKRPDLASRMAVLRDALPDLRALQDLTSQAPVLRSRADIGDLLTPEALRAAFSDQASLDAHVRAIEARVQRAKTGD